MMHWSDAPPVVVNVQGQAELLSDLATRFRNGQGFSVATLNLDHVVKLQRDPGFQAAYLAQTHVTADGNPIVWLCRLARQTDVTLVPGSELVEPMITLAAEHGVKVALFGSTDVSLQATSRAMCARCPELDVVLCLAPKMGFDPNGAEAEAAISTLQASGAQLVFLALGAPKQEQFAARAQKALPQTGFLSIGAGLDFISGSQVRAPIWVRKIAAEWLWRMLRNPRRLALRYTACILAMPGLTWRALYLRRTERGR